MTIFSRLLVKRGRELEKEASTEDVRENILRLARTKRLIYTIRARRFVQHGEQGKKKWEGDTTLAARVCPNFFRKRGKRNTRRTEGSGGLCRIVRPYQSRSKETWRKG